MTESSDREYLANLLKHHCIVVNQGKLIPSRTGITVNKNNKQEYQIAYACQQLAKNIKSNKLYSMILQYKTIYPKVTYVGNSSTLQEKISSSTWQKKNYTKDYRHIHGKGYDNE